MRCSIAALSIALLSWTAAATPARPDLARIVASLPIAELGPPQDASSLALAHSSLPANAHTNSTLQAADLDPLFLLCQFANCQNCATIDVVGLPTDECFASPGGAVLSAATVQTNQVPLPFRAAVGTAGCAQLATLTAPNMCFNLNGPVQFTTFALLV